MNDILDPNLLARFDAAKNASLDEEFVAALMARVDRDRRRNLAVWLFVAILVGAAGTLAVEPVAASFAIGESMAARIAYQHRNELGAGGLVAG